MPRFSTPTLALLSAALLHAVPATAQPASLSLSSGGGGPFVRIPAHNDFNLQQFSASVWFKPTGPGENGGGTLITKPGINMSGSNLCSWWLGWEASTGRVQALAVHEFGVSGRLITSATSVPIGQEAHAVFTFDGTTLRLYINGALSTQQPFGFTGLYDSSQDIRIGAFNPGGGYVQNHFQGTLDDVTIWNRALSAAEVVELASCEIQGSAPGLIAHIPFTCNRLSDTSGAGHPAVAVNAIAYGSQAALLSAPPVLCDQLANTIACPTGTANITVVAAGTGTTAYQWQWQAPPFAANTPWNNVVNGSVNGLGTVAGAGTQSLTISQLPGSSGMLDPVTFAKLRCTASNSCGNVTSNVANLTMCPADFNCDAITDFFDYLDFVSAFSTSDPVADFNADTVLDFFDYLDFVNAFAQGC